MSRDDKTMEEHAAEHRERLTEKVRLLDLLNNASDSDDIESDDWHNLRDEFDIDPECDNCGAVFTDHIEMTDEDGRKCPESDIDTEFYMRKIPIDLYEQAEQYIQESNYGIGVSITVDVQLYGGGPAGGIEFDCSRGRYGLEMDSARVWHQDWFQPKGYAPLDDDTAQRLFDLWGLEYATGEE